MMPIDPETAWLSGELTGRAQTNGVQVPLGDGMIATRELHHGFQFLTRSTEGLAAAIALSIDPWT